MDDKTLYYTDYECRLKLQELYDGRSIVVPCDEEHARFMLMVASKFLDDRHRETIEILTK